MVVLKFVIALPIKSVFNSLHVALTISILAILKVPSALKFDLSPMNIMTSWTGLISSFSVPVAVEILARKTLNIVMLDLKFLLELSIKEVLKAVTLDDRYAIFEILKVSL